MIHVGLFRDISFITESLLEKKSRLCVYNFKSISFIIYYIHTRTHTTRKHSYNNLYQFYLFNAKVTQVN
jgi:hypothetical protein